MLYFYKAIYKTGEKKEGSIEAINVDAAIIALQKQDLILKEIKSADDKKDLFDVEISFFSSVSSRDIVILSRQLSTLFDAQVSALRIFRLVGEQTENKVLRKHLAQMADDLQGGSSISNAMTRHPDVFSDFYVNMVRAGEESGKLDETFNYLADYLDRTYEVTSKAKNALIYPAFVIVTFIGVMILMFSVIIPKIAVMLTDSGQEIPIYTKIVLAISSVVVNYGVFLGIGLIILSFIGWKYVKTPEGSRNFAYLKLSVPYVGNLYKKLYLSRISDNMATMINSGIPMLRALDITASVVDNEIYKEIIDNAAAQVKAGVALSNTFSQYSNEMPGILVQMIRVGEETGQLGAILKTLAKFYEREVITAVDTLVSLIEPVMIVALGLGVGVLLASVLMPIYNIAAAT